MLEFDDAPKGLARVIYASQARDVERGAFAELVRTVLVKSIHNNRLAAVTGFLVAGEGRFLQLLEGPVAEVQATFERIRRDERHFDVSVISHGVVERRLFRDWNMGQHQIVAADQDVLAKAGLATFAPEALDEAGALTILTTLGGRYLR
jgi:hypothetical protein